MIYLPSMFYVFDCDVNVETDKLINKDTEVTKMSKQKALEILNEMQNILDLTKKYIDNDGWRVQALKNCANEIHSQMFTTDSGGEDMSIYEYE